MLIVNNYLNAVDLVRVQALTLLAGTGLLLASKTIALWQGNLHTYFLVNGLGLLVCQALPLLVLAIRQSSPLLLAAANLVARVTPLTRGFALRRRLFGAAGVQLHASTKICGTTTIQHSNVAIGAETWVGSEGCIIATNRAPVTIGDRCDIGPGVMLVVGSHRVGGLHRRAGEGYSEPVSIGDGTWLGARVTMISGAAIGRGCVVASGSVVTKKFGDNLLIAGVPAKVVRELGE